MSCSQNYCEKCHQELTQECPTCRSKDKRVQNRMAEKLIEKIPFSCQFAPHGCQVELAQSDLKKHEETCTFGNLKCSFSTYGCPEKMAKTKLGEHEADCGYQIVACSYQDQGCKTFMRKSDIKKDHEMIYRDLLPCKYQEQGCGEKKLFKELEDHEKDCKYSETSIVRHPRDRTPR